MGLWHEIRRHTRAVIFWSVVSFVVGFCVTIFSVFIYPHMKSNYQPPIGNTEVWNGQGVTRVHAKYYMNNQLYSGWLYNDWDNECVNHRMTREVNCIKDGVATTDKMCDTQLYPGETVLCDL